MRRYRFKNTILRIVFTPMLRDIATIDYKPGALVSHKLFNGCYVSEGQMVPEGVKNVSFLLACLKTRNGIKRLLEDRNVVFLRAFPEWNGDVIRCRFVVNKE